GTQRDVKYLREIARRLWHSPPAVSVLLVDPDLTGAGMLAAALPKDYRARVVGSAAAARTAIAEELPNVVVTDLHLPDATGFELLAALRTWPTTRHVLLMVLAAHLTISEKIAVFQVGADDCLIKPVAPSAFALHVQRLSYFRQTLGS